MLTHIDKLVYLLGTLVLFSSCAPKETNCPKLQIVRQEVGGSLNVIPVNVKLDGKQVGTLVGESTFDLPIVHGDHVLAIEYVNPFNDRGRLRHKEMHISVSNSLVRASLNACSLDESTYSGEWHLDVLPPNSMTKTNGGTEAQRVTSRANAVR